jgi:drug/metabolite transporter (DMT)-like permease
MDAELIGLIVSTIGVVLVFRCGPSWGGRPPRNRGVAIFGALLLIAGALGPLLS